MRYIKNFLHNINDVVLAVVIVALAAGIIYWRLQIILDYPKQLADQQAVYNEEQAEAEDADAAEQEAVPEEKTEEAPAENADAAEEAAQETAPAEEAPADDAAEQPEG